MATSDEYLREHNIKSVSLVSHGTFAPVMLIKIDDEELRIEMTQDMIDKMINDTSEVDRLMEDVVSDYERDIKMEERKEKFDKITKIMGDKNLDI